MNTKIFSVLIVSILMLSLMGTFVLADENEDSASVSAEAGLSTAEISTAIADEKVESSSGILSDKFKILFANKGEKAKIRMDIANKRMNELKKAENNPDKVKKIAKEYEAELDNALESFDEIAVDGDKEQVIHALKQTVIMKYRLETHGEKVTGVHARILTRQSEKMNAEQIAHLTDVFSNINTKVVSKISQIEARQENLIARAVVLGFTEEEVRAKLESFEASLNEKRQLRDNQFKERIKAEFKADKDGKIKQKFEFKT
ncbi:MAG: hypothetical protein AABX80_01605, partial [Nanoarchaeota archaeon]